MGGCFVHSVSWVEVDNKLEVCMSVALMVSIGAMR